MVRDALIAALTNPAYQASPAYADNFNSLAEMQVEKSLGGGVIRVPPPF